MRTEKIADGSGVVLETKTNEKEWLITVRKPFYNPGHCWVPIPGPGPIRSVDGKNYDEQKHHQMMVGTALDVQLYVEWHYGVDMIYLECPANKKNYFISPNFRGPDNRITFVTATLWEGYHWLPLHIPK